MNVAELNVTPTFDTEEIADAFGVSAQFLDDETQKWWKLAYKQAKLETDARAKALAKDSYENKDIKTPLGTLVAEFDMREYLWLKQQYGPDVFRDYDFIMCYRKFRDQQHLATPSRSSFET